MTTTEQPGSPLEMKELPVHRDGKLDPILGRIDLVAIVFALLGVCLLGIAVVVLAVVKLAWLVSNLWADSFDRWLLIGLAAAIVWVVARWKKLCVF